MKTVSVIVTTRNEEKNIAACLESVAAQTFPKIEIIVVDNASTDQTKSIAARYTDNVFDKGPERSAQRNFGVANSSGEYVLYLDADMVLSEDAVAQCVAEFEGNPQLRGLYVPEIVVGKESFWIKVRRFEREFYNGTVIDAVRFIRRGVFEEVGGFDVTLTGPEDWDFDKKIRALGPVAVISAPLYHNEGRFDLPDYLRKKRYYANNFDDYVAKWGADDTDIRRQLGFFYRFIWVFLERGKFLRLLAHPLLTCGMYYLRFRVGSSYLARKVRD